MTTDNTQNTAGTEKKVAPAEKKLNFLQKQWRNIAMLIALIVLWLFTGISVWFTILFLAFFWAATTMAEKPSSYKVLAKILKVIFMLALINLVIIEFFPRRYSTRETRLAMLDQFFTGKPEYTVTTAKDIFEANRKRASEEFLKYYESLLLKDQTQEALDTLAGFERHWNFKLDTKKEDDRFGFIRPGQGSSNQGQSQIQPQPQPQFPAPIAMAQKDSVFRTGEYEVELVNGATPFNVVVWFDNGSGNYTLESQNFELFVQFPSEKPIKAVPGANFGHRIGPRFRIFGEEKKVKLVIT